MTQRAALTLAGVVAVTGSGIFYVHYRQQAERTVSGRSPWVRAADVNEARGRAVL